MLTDADQDRLDAIKQQAAEKSAESSARLGGELERLRAAHPGPLSRMGPRTIGDFSIVEPGCEIFARTGIDGLMRLGGDDPETEGVQARGGIVLEVTDVTDVTDDGEIVRRRAFRVLDYDHRLQLHEAFATLTEAQVNPDRFSPMRVDRVHGQYRRLCKWVGEQRGTASGFEIDLVIDAARLAAIVGQRTR